MPASSVQWSMFLFFAIGAAGGWLVLGIIAVEAVKTFRKVR